MLQTVATRNTPLHPIFWRKTLFFNTKHYFLTRNNSERQKTTAKTTKQPRNAKNNFPPETAAENPIPKQQKPANIDKKDQKETIVTKFVEIFTPMAGGSDRCRPLTAPRRVLQSVTASQNAYPMTTRTPTDSPETTPADRPHRRHHDRTHRRRSQLAASIHARATAKLCLCGCTHPIAGRQAYASPSCRKRRQRQLDRREARSKTTK